MKPVSRAVLRRLKILLMADSEDNAVPVMQALSSHPPWDCTFTRVENARELAEAIKRQDVDVVLTDSALTHFSTEQALEILHQHGTDVPLIVVSDCINEEEAAALMAAGVHDCLSSRGLTRLPLVIEREMAAAEQRHRLTENERVLGSLASRLPGYIFQRVQAPDGSFRFTYLSESLRQQFGVDPEEVMAHPGNFWNLIHPDDQESLRQVFADAHAKLEPYHVEYRAILPDDRIAWVRVRAQPTQLENGDVVWDGLGLDVTAEKSVQERLNYLAYFDAITDLPNRHLFLDRLGQAIKQTARAGRGLALHMIDLDNFKDVNDTLGHAAGDILLRQVAERLSSVVRESDILARLGGDEFTLIQTGVMDMTAADQLASKLLAELQQDFMIENHELQILASIGIACYGPMFEDMHADNHQTELVKRADLALYDAKNQGRNTYRFYSRKLDMF